MFELKTPLIFIVAITFFLINIILGGIEFWIYKRTKEKGALTTTKGFILGAVGILLWIITDNIWIFLIIELFSGILVYRGMAEQNLRERATGISLLEQCEQGIPIENIQYKPIKTKPVIIEVTLDIIISLLLGLFFFYIFDDYGLLLAFLLASGTSGISMMILLRKFKKGNKKS